MYPSGLDIFVRDEYSVACASHQLLDQYCIEPRPAREPCPVTTDQLDGEHNHDPPSTTVWSFHIFVFACRSFAAFLGALGTLDDYRAFIGDVGVSIFNLSSPLAHWKKMRPKLQASACQRKVFPVPYYPAVWEAAANVLEAKELALSFVCEVYWPLLAALELTYFTVDEYRRLPRIHPSTWMTDALELPVYRIRKNYAIYKAHAPDIPAPFGLVVVLPPTSRRSGRLVADRPKETEPVASTSASVSTSASASASVSRRTAEDAALDTARPPAKFPRLQLHRVLQGALPLSAGAVIKVRSGGQVRVIQPEVTVSFLPT